MASTIDNSLKRLIRHMFDNGIGGESKEWHQIDFDYEELTRAKRKRDLIKELFDTGKTENEIKPIPEAPDFLESRLKDLRSTIGQLNKEIYLRSEMKKQFDEELEYQLSRATLLLSHFKFWGLGYNTGVDVKRNMLERQLVDFRKEKRKTELQCWEDIISLKKELRTVLDEYKMLVTRRESMV
jgi:hypothetical protein